MTALRWLTAGESHGPALIGILEGLPRGVPVTAAAIEAQLARRRLGYGRSARQQLETDRVQILAGVRGGRSTGAPIALLLPNRDFEQWRHLWETPAGSELQVGELRVGASGIRQLAAPNSELGTGAGAPTAHPPPDAPPPPAAALRFPRPGHADYAGGVKYGTPGDMRDVLERASARETAMRVALGAIARALLSGLGVEIASHVRRIGSVAVAEPAPAAEDRAAAPTAADAIALNARADASPVRCLDDAASAAMVQTIDAARAAGDTLGGTFEVLAAGLPIGLGSHVQWDRRLDGRLAAALMSIPGVKAAEVGAGAALGELPGSRAHDPFLAEPADPAHPAGATDRPAGRPAAPRRAGNRHGGLEGGMTTGALLSLRATMKPLATLARPLPSVAPATGEPGAAHVERSDVTAVPAAAVVAEAMTALVLAEAVLEKFGGDTWDELADRVARARAGNEPAVSDGPHEPEA